MALIKQLVRRELEEAAIEKKKKKIQAVINANPAFKRAVDERVGAKRPRSEEGLEEARIMGIRATMRKNLRFAKLVADAAKS
jgi:hypothetical protein